ncbi:MAG TPA: hypothetical protein VGE72_30160 [Azospirillum sp.]
MTMTGTMRDVAWAGAPLRRSGVGLGLAVLLLAGCPGPTVTSDSGAMQSVAPGKLALIQPPPPKVKPPIRTNEAQTAPTPPRPAAVQALAVTGKIDPEALVGLDQGQTRRLLGVPVSTEEQAPAKVWRYVDGVCTLKVFFFMDMTTQDFRALSYDMKSSENVPDVDQRCFAHLLAQAGDGRND